MRKHMPPNAAAREKTPVFDPESTRAAVIATVANSRKIIFGSALSGANQATNR